LKQDRNKEEFEMSTPHDPQSVRELAYRLWVERGKPEGGAEKDWYEAERQLLGRRRSDSQRVDEAAKESFPASDPPATGLPDKPPANAGEKWRAADAAKKQKRRSKASPAASAAPAKQPNPDESDEPVARKPRDTTPKLGSRDAPGG
jgi:hypothetical protein